MKGCHESRTYIYIFQNPLTKDCPSLQVHFHLESDVLVRFAGIFKGSRALLVADFVTLRGNTAVCLPFAPLLISMGLSDFLTALEDAFCVFMDFAAFFAA